MSGDNWKPHMLALAEEAAEQLQGTCKTIVELRPEFEAAQDDQTFCDRLDEIVFECTVCNWWCEQSEMAEDCGNEWVCQDCAD